MKKQIAQLLAVIMCLGAILSSSTQTTYATSYLKENETATVLNNDDFDSAKYLDVYSLLKKTTYSYLTGGFYGEDDTQDVYKLRIGSSYGSEGRIAIELENIPDGDNYDIYLYDEDGNQVGESSRSDNENEIIKTEKVTSSSEVYYLVVVPTTVTSYDDSTYNILIENYISTGSKTVSLTPSSLTTASGTWSSYAYYKATSLPSNAYITSATVQSTKSGKSYDAQLQVKIGDNYTETVDWSSGSIDLDIDSDNEVLASDYWYVRFTATESPTIKLGKVIYTGYVGMKSFKMTVNYEYDTLTDY